MDKNLFNQINIDPANTNLPNGMADDPEAECSRYDALLDSLGGTDLQLLGIGFNGHVAFIEPSDYFHKRTKYEKLAETTIKANSRFFSGPAEVPEYAYTMGIRDIMYAKKIIMLAGPEKKDIVEKAAYGKITPEVPASVLQLHRDATVIVAEAAD
jgi:glucosamine-6-phosphate deaminase